MAIYSTPAAAANVSLLSPAQTETWLAWPGGQSSTLLNPTEAFKSEDMGFVGTVNWDVSTGVILAVIVEMDGSPTNVTSGSAKSIKVRYDTVSASSSEADTVLVTATDGVTTVTKKRTVFKISVSNINSSNQLHTKNPLKFPAETGTNQGFAGFNVPGQNGAARFSGKVEAIFTISPNDIAWGPNKGISFELDNNIRETGRPPSPWKKGQVVARRKYKGDFGSQDIGGGIRTHRPSPVFVNDGDADNADCAYPNIDQRAFIFRIDAPGNRLYANKPMTKQQYMRVDLLEYIEFYNGSAWSDISFQIAWFNNMTGALPALNPVSPNDHGSGSTTELVPNNKPVIDSITAIPNPSVSVGTEVTLYAIDHDDDKDFLIPTNYQWVQTSGPSVTMNPVNGKNTSIRFTPSTPGTYIFSVTVKDGTQSLVHPPGNSQSDPVSITITVT